MRYRSQYEHRLLTLLPAALLLLLSPAVAPAGEATLDRTSFDARGEHDAILTVGAFGRYAIKTKSPQGTSLQLVDAMIGPGESSGIAGESDGRIDSFLDAGRYRILLRSHREGRGKAELSVEPFVELNAPQAPLMSELQAVSAKLEDLEQASWWLHIDERRTVYIEAVGRNLADLRLWQDGSWLVDSTPAMSDREPSSGRPMTYCLLVADLTPGYYLLTAYGGAQRAWSAESSEQPLHIRYGIDRLPATTRTQARVSPFGFDHWIVESPASYYLLQLHQKIDFRIEVRPFEPGQPFDQPQSVARITTKSQDPQCVISASGTEHGSLVTVTGAPGEPYTLQTMDTSGSTSFIGPRELWISTVHAGYMKDNIDATAILVPANAERPGVRPTAADVIHLSATSGWSRRFNLLGENTLYLSVDEAGDYQVELGGTAASWKIEPLLTELPEGYETPPFTNAAATKSLDAGYFLFTIRPEQKGVVEATIRKKGGVLARALEAVSGPAAEERTTVKGASRFSRVVLERDVICRLLWNTQHDVRTAVVVREYPLRLEAALPVCLRSGEEETIAFIVDETSQATITPEGRAPFKASLDGAPCDAGGCGPVAAGQHTIRLHNSAETTAVFSVRTIPERLLPSAKPVYPPEGFQEQLPRFATLSDKAPVFADWARGERKTFLLAVTEPALYRVETTGLLKTSCTIRTRTRTRLFSAESNGVGRNALVQQYLKPGEYQVTVQTLDSSAGHAGVGISRSDLIDGGLLETGKSAASSLPAGSAIEYDFKIEKPGRYRFLTFGLGKTFACRLEDSDGWPLREASGAASFEQEFIAGGYRFMTLPWNVGTLRVTRFDLVEPPRQVEGHGPHELKLDEYLEKIWRESPQGQKRERDLYEIAIPASIDATITLSESQMQAFIVRLDGDKSTIVDTVPPENGWHGALAPGKYRIEVECSRQNDRLPYGISVRADQLIAGTSKSVSVPAELKASVSREGIHEISSAGALDVRAELFSDATGARVDEGDDAFDDWNVHMSPRLAPGRYTLRLHTVGNEKKGTTTVSMRAPEEVAQPQLTLPADLQVDLGGAINLFPIPPLGDGDVISVEVEGAGETACSVEMRLPGGGWTVVKREIGRSCAIASAAEAAAEYQIRVWSADHRSETARLRVAAIRPRDVMLAELERGLDLAREGGVRCLRVAAADPGVFRIEGAGEVIVAHEPGEPLLAPAGDLLPIPPGRLYLMPSKTVAPITKLRAFRVKARPGSELRLAVRRGEELWVDVERPHGGVLLLQAASVTGRAACAFSPFAPPPPLSRLASYSIGRDASASAVMPAGTAKARVWNADPAGVSTTTISLKLSEFTAPAARDPALQPGVTEAAVAAGSVRHFTLPAGAKRVALVVERDLTALIARDGSVEAVIATDASAANRKVETGAGMLSLLNTGSNERSARITLAAIERDPLVSELKPGLPFEAVTDLPGVVRLHTQAGQTLRVEGEDVQCEAIDDRGLIHEGSRIDLAGGEAAVTLRHGLGFVKAWIEQPGEGLRERWGPIADAPIIPARAQSLIGLDGRQQWISITTAEPSTISLRMSRQAAVCVSRRVGSGSSSAPASTSAWLQTAGAGDPLIHVADRCTAFDYYLEAGTHVIGLRALANGTLEGDLLIGTQPVVAMPAGVGPACLLGGGDTKTFAFEVKQKGRVGIGARTDRESIDCELLTRDQRLIGRGTQQFVELEAGTYLLRLIVPAGEPPVRVSPVVVGLEPPGVGPPEDYLREFLGSIGVHE